MVAFVSISHVLIVIKNRSINKELGHGGLEDSRKSRPRTHWQHAEEFVSNKQDSIEGQDIR
jgi:hypothetical protein